MPQASLQELRDAASSAHARGDTEGAVGLFRKILDLFPDTPEAAEAVFYLSSIGKGPRRAARRVSGKREDMPTKRAAKDGSEGIS